jgi:plastocyanin
MIEVSGTEFAFDPADFDVEAGRPVAVTFVNEGTAEHDWTLRTLDGEEVEGAHANAGPGEEAAAVFTLEPGTYEAWCTLPGHYEGGMKGTVVAE